MTDILADREQLRADADMIERLGGGAFARAAAALRLAANVHGTRLFDDRLPVEDLVDFRKVLAERHAEFERRQDMLMSLRTKVRSGGIWPTWLD